MVNMARMLRMVSALVCIYVISSQDDIRMPPSITVQGPEFVIIFRTDDEVTLPCIAEGIPTPNYAWMKNNANFQVNRENIKFGPPPSGQIKISGASTMDEGYYQCTAENMYGKTASKMYILKRAVLDAVGIIQDVARVDATEGEAFKIPNQPIKCFPPPTYSWEMALDKVDNNPSPVFTDGRIQIDEKGFLWFSFAKMGDGLDGKRIYKNNVYNAYMDVKTGGSYTNVTVKKSPGGERTFAPVIAFSTDTPVTAVEKRNITLECFFSGNPVPTIEWTGPGNTLPINRHTIDSHKTKLHLRNVTASDEGDYVCSGQNSQGPAKERRIQIKVEAAPEFRSPSDGPENVNVTEGSDYTVHCNAYAKPEAAVKWYINAVLLKSDSLPSRISLSSDKKSLTIRNLCRDCKDGRTTDIMVIQCNASNVHGYAFGSGYLNVLKPTVVTVTCNTDDCSYKEVEMKTELTLEYTCMANSDPITKVTPKWYNVTKQEETLYVDLPGLEITDGVLKISVKEGAEKNWRHYGGIYKCHASNGYSDDIKKVEIFVRDLPILLPSTGAMDYWWIFLIIALVLLLLILILCCCMYMRRNRGDKYDVDEKERQNGNDPIKEMEDTGFQDYKRPEEKGLKGSKASLGSSVRLNSDEEASLNEYGDDPGKFGEDGSFVGVYVGDKKRGRSEVEA